ncbi:MAG TPA: TolC family protein [Candidatus Binatia bacterium]|nr:TolC family protein [Candidatus Binatia bacterium]
MRTLPAILAIAAVLLAALPVQRGSAQTPQPAPSMAEIVGVTQKPFVGIALQDAVAMALLKNPSLGVSASNVRIARYRIVEAKANFDVQLKLEPSSSFSVTPPENVFFAGPGSPGLYQCYNEFTGQYYTCSTQGPGNIIQHQSSFQYGITGQSVNGTSYAAGIVQTRTYNNTLINTFNPTYQASLSLSVTQPLLRNLGMNTVKRQLKLSTIDADSNEAQALVDASNTISQVEDSYWNLVAAWRAVAIQEEALKEASDQERSVARLAKRGAAPPVGVVEVQAQVAKFQAGVFSAIQTVSQLQIQLKSLIVADPKDPIWNANLVPSSPVQELPAAGDLAAIVAQAQRNRPEVRQAYDVRRQADVDRAYAKNQALPQGDLQILYMSNGFAGLLAPIPHFEQLSCNLPNLGCPTPPPETQGTMAYAYHNLWAARYPTFNVSFVFNIPIENNVARGLAHTADEEEDQAAIQMQNVNQRIGSEANDALQAYQSALSRLYAGSKAREAAEAVYASEVRRFHNGTSTTFLVLQRQVELEEARGRELQAQTDLNKAVVELQRVEGTILSANGVDIEKLGTKTLAH